MLLIVKLRSALIKHFLELKWQTILFAIFAYAVICWLLLYLSGETALINHKDFLYWLVVTTSTVGYGDLSPETFLGKMFTSFFIIPFGLGLFGLVIGRVAAFFSYHWRKKVIGLSSFNYSDHIIMLGWNSTRTIQLIKLLLREMEYETVQRKIVLCVRESIENPLPDQISFIRVNSYTDDDLSIRASLTESSIIIIDNPDDDLTMTSSLYCADINPDAHIIAYFKDPKLGNLLKAHCPNVECMPSVAVEMIAKSAVDPGSSALHHQLLNVSDGMTQYSITYSGGEELKVGSVFQVMKEKYGATLIAVSNGNLKDIMINPALEHTITNGTSLFYIADERINNINWKSFSV